MSWIDIDQKHIWHPYTQEHTAGPNIPIERAKGSWLYASDGKKYLDAVSSWWVTAHGHCHPHITKRVSNQLAELEHCIFAGFTHPRAAEVTERVLSRLPKHQHAFFSDNGSTSVEVALKMAFQYWHNKGQEKTKIIAIDGAYHGDTFGAMSVSGRSSFTEPFKSMLFDVEFIPFPGDGTEKEAIAAYHAIASTGDVAGIIYEPMVQGASGMRVMSQECLTEIITDAQSKGIITIADEVFTGFGRTGKFFASDHLVHPDIACLSKALTGGTMALGLTTCMPYIYESFLSKDPLKAFFHGHSYTGNPIACAAACASLDLFDKKETWDAISAIEYKHSEFIASISSHRQVRKARCLGTIAALDIQSGDTGYFNPVRERLYPWFLQRGVLLRPLGNTIYIVPPYCITEEELHMVYALINEFLETL